jgi:hypothetical protein
MLASLGEVQHGANELIFLLVPIFAYHRDIDKSGVRNSMEWRASQMRSRH